MNPGSIHNPNTAAARVYRLLRDNPGPYDAYALQTDAATTALSTRISEVRAQLPVGEKVVVTQRGRRWFYEVVRDYSAPGTEAAA